MDAKPSRPTIRDVAAAAGVHIATVSRVLSGHGYSSEEARRNVLAAAEALGYRPSRQAQNLRGAKLRIVGAVVSDLANPVFIQWLRGVEAVAHERDFSVIIADCQGSAEIERTALERLFDERVSGLLMADPNVASDLLSPFYSLGIPVLPASPEEAQDLHVIASTAQLAGHATLAKRLIELGHRRIAWFVPTTDRKSSKGVSDSRVESLRRAFISRGGTMKFVSVHRQNLIADCRAEVGRLSSGARAPTVYMAGSHLVAPGLLIAIQDAGLRVPEDVSVVSYGDSDWALAHRPTLSVLRWDYYALGVAMAKRLIASIEGEQVPEVALTTTEFVERGSLGPASHEAGLTIDEGSGLP